MKRILSIIPVMMIGVICLSACGKDNFSNSDGKSSDVTTASSEESDFPDGLVRVMDKGDGKLVFIIDTDLIDDDLSGVVQCEVAFDDYSVNYVVWGENSLNCDIVYHYEEDGKHLGRTVVSGEYEFKDGKLIITFPAAEVCALEDFSYSDFEQGRFYVFRDDTHKVFLEFSAADIIVNDDTAIAEGNLTNDYGIGYRSSSFDLQYFTPATDDFVITAYDTADSEGNLLQTNALFSFDDAGDCVQWVARIEMPVEKELGSADAFEIAGENGYYRDYTDYLDAVNNNVCGGKVNVILALTNGGEVYVPYYVEEGLVSGARMYCSKPLDSVKMNGTLTRGEVSLDVISPYIGSLGVGNDYAVILDPDQVVESFTDERTLIVNGKPVEDGDHQPVMQEYLWPEITYDNYIVVEYDSDGYSLKQYEFYVFDDPDMIYTWLYRFSVLNYNWEHPEDAVISFPGQRSESPIPVAYQGDFMALLDDSWELCGENKLCHILGITLSDDEESRRLQHKMPAGVLGNIADFSYYYSDPSLTKNQLEALDMIWEYRTFGE